MGDIVTLIIHSCPPSRVRAVADTLENSYSYSFESEDEDEDEDRKFLKVGHPCDIDVSTVDELALALRAVAPEMAFTAYNSPTDEWLGTLCHYVPGLGMFEASCDHDGAAVLSVARILELDQVSYSLRRGLLGVPWTEAIAAMPGEDVTEPQPYTARWDPANGEITVLEAGDNGADVSISLKCFTSVSDDGVLADCTAADTALARNGYVRGTEWEARNITCRIWAAVVYRCDGDEAGYEVEDGSQTHSR